MTKPELNAFRYPVSEVLFHVTLPAHVIKSSRKVPINSAKNAAKTSMVRTLKPTTQISDNIMNF